MQGQKEIQIIKIRIVNLKFQVHLVLIYSDDSHFSCSDYLIMSRSGMVIHPIHRRWCDEVTTSLTAERVATSNQPLIGKWKGFDKMCGQVCERYQTDALRVKRHQFMVKGSVLIDMLQLPCIFDTSAKLTCGKGCFFARSGRGCSNDQNGENLYNIHRASIHYW
ncbi:hypothetical protein SAY86_019664 [Trapa natans]|uniref:Uncharacterized protein n=1 Tax=Trapa natans TaxID=22666 RepID=A0AAN7R4X1_TRANT|nr:hypothetical protein SAY86_019664 [Trapa natans]